MKKVMMNEKGDIRCPTCNKLVLEHDKPLKQCKHVLAWYDGVGTDYIYIKPHIKKQMAILFKDCDLEETEEMERFFSIYKLNVSLIYFEGEELGGCVFENHTVAFSKNV